MIRVSDKEFDDMVAESFSAISKLHLDNLENVAIVVEDHPTAEQEKKLGLRCNQLLFGLFEGVPRPQKGSGGVVTMPDKITLFKGSLLRGSNNKLKLRNNVRNTLWHEIGHYYGLNHTQIHKLEHKHH